MALHKVNHTFDSLSVGGQACSRDEFFLGKPVASVSTERNEYGFWGDTPEDLPLVVEAFVREQKEQKGERRIRYMQPHIVTLVEGR